MNETNPRIIHSRLSSRQIPDLLQIIFAGELLAPSQCLWLVSPWVSDIPVLDNRANAFQSLNADWGSGPVRLAGLLITLAGLGVAIHVATRPVAREPHNAHFLQRLRDARLTTPRLKIHQAEKLHEKGLLTDSCYLGGSMNFTSNGISFNEEQVSYFTDAATVAHAHIVFRERWGGPLP